MIRRTRREARSQKPEARIGNSGFLGFWLLVSLACTLPVLAQRESPLRFSNVAAESGIDFKHESGATPEKYMPETMGAGALIFDYDNDEWPDVFLVNGGSFVNKQTGAAARHRLYRNNRNGRFTDATAAAGIGVSGFGMGACSADYDNNGWADLYVTSFGGNRLYRNTGTGRFEDVTDKAGVGSKLWSASCAFGDIDNDGDVDLYVTNYVDFAVNNNKYCNYSGAVRVYCHPNVYNGLPDILYRNNGNGTFTDVSREAGIYRSDGKGLGVVFGDYDNDGWSDIYVANDSVPNFLFHNKGSGVFEEVGLRAGVAVGSDGQPLAGMGTDMGDIDGDGLLDIFVTNLDRQTHSLYRNLGKGLFADVTFESGVAEATLPFVGFGAAFFDYDNDGDLDLAVANGDVIDNVSLFRDSTSYEQQNLLLQNNGEGKFRDAGPAAGPGFAIKKASRSLAAGDLDNDGDLDLLIGNIGQTADLLRNDGGNRSNSLLVRTTGSKSNRDGIGARLKLTLGGKVQVREVKAGSSYLAQNDLRVHFGLGAATRADRLEIRWPSGIVDVIENIEASQIVTVLEGKGISARRPFNASNRSRAALDASLAELNQGRVLEAIGQLKQIVRDDPAFGPAHFYLSTLYTEMKEFEIAYHHLERAIETNPKQGAYHYQLGVIRFRQKKWRPALVLFEGALKMGVGKDEAAVWRGIGDVYVELFDRDKALEAYETALGIQPKDVGTRLALGHLYLERNDPDKAIPQLRAAVDLQPELPRVYAALGRAYRRIGDAQSAVTVLRRAIQLDPADQESRYGLGQALLAAGRSDEGREELNRYQSIRDRVSQANTNFEAATVLVEAGDLAGAEKLLDEAADLAPTHGPTLHLFGTVLLDRGKREKAVELFKRALAANPLNSASHFGLGRAYFQMGKLQEAAEATRRAIVLNDEDPRYDRQLEEIVKSQ